MRKVCVLLMIAATLFSLTGCKKETVTLHCDTEGCENTVVVELGKDETADESWVVFCKKCADEKLSDK